ncbi:hypothetical protein [Nitrososphaera sp.]|uniref:hypothetical protein n=1 Tax=Nitrososphaera sp. TaxID=1971748 RepID=UPI003170763F
MYADWRILLSGNISLFFGIVIIPIILGGLGLFIYEILSLLDTSLGTDLKIEDVSGISVLLMAAAMVLPIRRGQPRRITKNYCERIGYEKIVFRYLLLKRVLVYWSPVLIISTALFVVQGVFFDQTLDETFQRTSPLVFRFPAVIMIISFAAFYSTYLAFSSIVGEKQSKLFIARGCAKLGTITSDKINQIHWIIDALFFYNHHIKRIFGLQVKNLEKIQSKIISDSIGEQNQIIDSLHSAFMNGDELEPSRLLSMYSGITNQDQFLVKEKLSSRIKEWISIVGPIVGGIYVVIQIIVILSPKT